MGKRRTRKPRHIPQHPDFNNPVCPTCGKMDMIVDESEGEHDDDPMFECTRCWVRFMYEDSSVEQDDTDDVAAANVNMGTRAEPPVLKLKCALCLGRGCEVCHRKKKKDTREYQTEPVFGEMEELTDAVARR